MKGVWGGPAPQSICACPWLDAGLRAVVGWAVWLYWENWGKWCGGEHVGGGRWRGGAVQTREGGLLTGEFTYWPSGDVPQLRCGCWKTNPCSKSWHYTSTQLKLSCEGQAEILSRVWLHSDKVLAIQKQTNIQTNIVLSLWHLRTALWQCPNIAISICTPWIITQNAGILGRPKLFYYF